MPYLTTDTHKIFYTDEGQGPETVLFIHGGTCDSHDWSAQIAPFTARHRVIAPDLTGHGRSTDAGPNAHPSHYADELARLLDNLGAGPVVAVGHSMGAAVASILAVDRPDLVRAVVAVDPAYGFDPEFAAAVAAAFHGPDPLAVAVATLAAMEGTGPQDPVWLSAWHRRRTLAVAPETTAAIFLGLFEAETEKTVRPAAERYLARRACPVLTVSATASLKAKGIDEDWDRTVSPHPYSDSVAWDGVGHWLFQERPEEFNTLILEWITRLPVRSARR